MKQIFLCTVISLLQFCICLPVVEGDDKAGHAGTISLKLSTRQSSDGAFKKPVDASPVSTFLKSELGQADFIALREEAMMLRDVFFDILKANSIDISNDRLKVYFMKKLAEHERASFAGDVSYWTQFQPLIAQALPKSLPVGYKYGDFGRHKAAILDTDYLDNISVKVNFIIDSWMQANSVIRSKNVSSTHILHFLNDMFLVKRISHGGGM